MFGKYRVIDLSMPIDGRTPGLMKPLWSATHWHGKPSGELVDMNRLPTRLNWHISIFTMGSHVGTHTEASYHRLKDGLKLYEVPLERWVGNAVCYDVSPKGPRELVTVRDLEEAEDKAEAELSENDIALIRTGWTDLFMHGMNTKTYMIKSPAMSGEAAKWLVERKVKMVGADFNSFDPEPPNWNLYLDAESTPGHTTLLEHGIPIVENLVNLKCISGRKVFFVGVPLRFTFIPDASPIRAIAILNER